MVQKIRSLNWIVTVRIEFYTSWNPRYTEIEDDERKRRVCASEEATKKLREREHRNSLPNFRKGFASFILTFLAQRPIHFASNYGTATNYLSHTIFYTCRDLIGLSSESFARVGLANFLLCFSISLFLLARVFQFHGFSRTCGLWLVTDDVFTFYYGPVVWRVNNNIGQFYHFWGKESLSNDSSGFEERFIEYRAIHTPMR